MATFTYHHERYQHNCHLKREKLETGKGKNVLPKLCNQEVEEPGFELRGLHGRLHCDIQTLFSRGGGGGAGSSRAPVWHNPKQAPGCVAETTVRQEPIKRGV